MKNRFFFGTLLVLSGILLMGGCDKGLGPINEPSGFGGVIHFKNWPPADSVRDLRVVAFEQFPADSSGILASLLTGHGAVYPADLTAKGSLPKFVDNAPYEFTTKNGINLKVQQYSYIVVAQLYGPNSFTDWRPAGVYTTEAGTFNPSPIRVLLHRITPNVDIEVDFHNPPPKPWR
jgi:hypothetical protein